jgi:mono/diheme cytochrome c family protein
MVVEVGVAAAAGRQGRGATTACLGSVALVATLLASALQAQELDDISSIWDGQYTAAQADRGKATYDRSCSRCHDSDLSGSDRGPPLIGDDFLDGWLDGTLEALFSYVRDSMPEGNASTVDDAGKADVLAYVLQNNSFPTGEAELPTDTVQLEMVQILREGDEPGLLNLSFVRVVGCLEPGSGTAAADDRWLLTRANARPGSRGSVISAADLERARTRELGMATYSLVSSTPFEPTTRRGHKVAAKGLLYLQPGDERLNLTALETLEDSCTTG